MRYVVALFIALTLNAAANLLMKIGMKSASSGGDVLDQGPLAALKTVITSVPLMVGLLCFLVNAAFYMYALQSETLKISIAYPIMVGGGFALIALGARWHPDLRESLSTGQWVGVGFVLVGIVTIATLTK